MGRFLGRPALEIAVDISAQGHDAIFHRDADLIGLDAGVELELAQDFLLDLFVGLHHDCHGGTSFLPASQASWLSHLSVLSFDGARRRLLATTAASTVATRGGADRLLDLGLDS